MRQRLRPQGDSGATAVLGLIVTLVVVLLAAALLQRTASIASSINDKAKTIALTGRGINQSTDSIMQLTKTNELAESILGSAKPLEGKLGEIVTLAKDVNGQATSINGSAKSINGSAKSINGTAGGINGSAKSINGTAGSINGTAKSINGTAGGINGNARAINGSAGAINGTAGGINREAAGILTTAQSLNRGVFLINAALDETIVIAGQIRGDTGNIVAQAELARKQSGKICRGVNGLTLGGGTVPVAGPIVSPGGGGSTAGCNQ